VEGVVKGVMEGVRLFTEWCVRMSKEVIKKWIEQHYGIEIVEVSKDAVTIRVPEELAYQVCHPELAGKVIHCKKGEAVPEELYRLYSIQDCVRLSILLSML